MNHQYLKMRKSVRLSCKVYKMRISFDILINCDVCEEGSNVKCGIHMDLIASVNRTSSQKDVSQGSNKPSSSRDHNVQCLSCKTIWRQNNMINHCCIVNVDETSPRSEQCRPNENVKMPMSSYVPRFIVSPYDTSQDHSQVLINHQDTLRIKYPPDTPPPLPPKNLIRIPQCLPPSGYR